MQNNFLQTLIEKLVNSIIIAEYLGALMWNAKRTKIMPWLQQEPSRNNILLQIVPINYSLVDYNHGKVLEHFYPTLEVFSKSEDRDCWESTRCNALPKTA